MKIQKNRSKDICLNYGIGFSNDINLEEELDFFIMSARSLNTFSKEEAERNRRQSTKSGCQRDPFRTAN